MKYYIFILSLLFSTFSYAEQYICIADLTTGFSFNSSLNRWENANFINDQNKYIVSKSDREGEEYKVIKIGDKYQQASCELGFNEPGYLFCEGLGGEFKINKHNGRYLKSYTLGYFNVVPKINKITDKDSDTPLIEIGKCSPL